MTAANPPTIWPSLRYQDAQAAVRLLVDVFGFTEALVVAAEADGVIAHAELRWPEGGGVMLGSAAYTESVHKDLPVGSGSVYVVTDDPDGILARATAAGVEVARGMREEDYGSRGFTLRDFEGNLWSFGTYRGHGA